MDEAEHSTMLRRQIDASDRTTHAVRALTTFIVYEAAYALASGILLAIAFIPVLSLQEPWWVLVVGAGGTAVIGLAHSFKTAFEELSKSEVPVGRDLKGVIRISDSSTAPNAATSSGPEYSSAQVVPGECDCDVATRRTLGVWKVGDSYVCKNCDRLTNA